MSSQFDYKGARDAGYSDDEIVGFLSEQNPDFDFQGAAQAGYSPEESLQFLSDQKPKRSVAAKTGRVAGQFAIGALENALLPYEISTIPLASKGAQTSAYRENLGEDIERLLEQKSSGVWDEQDQQLYDSLSEQMKNPEKSEQFVKTADIGVRSLIEKSTGLDLHPEGVLEKAASWAGFIKDPKKLAELAKAGLNPKRILKNVVPSGTETLRGLGAGAALEMAEEGEFGPLGTIAAAVVGDALGGGTAGVAKALSKPRESLAKIAAKFTPKDKLKLQKELIDDFKQSGIQADIGTLTDSNLIKMMQSRLAQSGLTGKSLDELRQSMTKQIKEDYKRLADSLGESRFATSHEAGETAKRIMKEFREEELGVIRNTYESAKGSLAEEAVSPIKNLMSAVEKLEKELKPGAIKSTEQQTVLSTLTTLKKDLNIFNQGGGIEFAHVKDLINNKIALNDIINYEVQGGAKQLLKGIVGEIDKAIIAHGKENAKFSRLYSLANKRFSEHAKTYRTPEMDRLLRETTDPSQVMNKMNSVQGIKNIEKVLGTGNENFNGLKRLKLDQIIGDNLIDSTTQQVKLGTFSKLLEQGKNREIVKELLGKEAFKRLELLQKNVGKLANTAQKFFNASKSGVVVEDIAVVAKALKDLANLFAGNPWPAARTAGGILGAQYLTRLISNPEFLKLVEDAILVSERDNLPLLMEIGQQLVEPIKAAINASRTNE